MGSSGHVRSTCKILWKREVARCTSTMSMSWEGRKCLGRRRLSERRINDRISLPHYTSGPLIKRVLSIFNMSVWVSHAPYANKVPDSQPSVKPGIPYSPTALSSPFFSFLPSPTASFAFSIVPLKLPLRSPAPALSLLDGRLSPSPTVILFPSPPRPQW